MHVVSKNANEELEEKQQVLLLLWLQRRRQGV